MLIAAIVCGVTAALAGVGLGIGLLLLALVGRSAVGPASDADPQVLIAALALGLIAVPVGLGLLLAWSGWRSLAGRPSRPWQWPAWGWWLLAFVAVVGTGQAAFQAGFRALVPAAHLAANVLAALGVLALALGGARRYVRPPSARAAGGSLAWGGLGAVALALVVEVLLAVVGLVILSIWLNAIQPELVASLRIWAERLQSGPPAGLQPMAPPPDVVAQLFRSPWVLLAILGGAAVLVPLIEETIKGLAVPMIALTGWRLRRVDGFLLGAAAGAGFALVEGVFNGAMGLAAPEAWASAMLSRGAATTMHCAAGGLVGLGWALAVGRQWLPALFAGALGLMLHAAWNAAAVGTAILTLAGMSGAPASSLGGNPLAVLFVAMLILLWLMAVLALAWLPRWLARMEAL